MSWLWSRLAMFFFQKPRMLFIIRRVTEVNGLVTKSPQYYNWPILGETILMFQITDTQQFDIAPVFLDKKGNPAKVDGAPEWFVDNPDVLSLTPSQDGLSCNVKAVGPLGTGKISVKADADLGQGVESLVGVLDVEVTPGKATTINLVPGNVTEQPE